MSKDQVVARMCELFQDMLNTSTLSNGTKHRSADEFNAILKELGHVGGESNDSSGLDDGTTRSGNGVEDSGATS